jgi:membrane protein CcdC involved in cytochrome C biogenesis
MTDIVLGVAPITEIGKVPIFESTMALMFVLPIVRPTMRPFAST